MTAVGLGQQGSQAQGPGSNICRAINFLMILLTFARNSNCSHGTVGRTTGFWSARYGFESQPLPPLFNFINTTENRDTPLFCMKIFDTRTSLNPGRVLLWNFLVLQNKKLSKENRDILFLCIASLDVGSYLVWLFLAKTWILRLIF